MSTAWKKLEEAPIRTLASFAPLIICGLILVYEVVVGSGGCVEVKPGEVAVRYNNTGVGILGEGTAVIVDQGVQTFIPGLQSVEKLERRPQILVMADEGKLRDRKRSAEYSQRVKGLTVRANDGSNFYFDVLEVHYQIKPRAASHVIEQLGPGDEFKRHLIATYARGVLRNEFGRYSFLEIADPTTYGAATTDGRTKLNEALEPYGVEVIQIVTPKPNFDARVEQAIEQRQNAEQEIEVQAEKRRKLEQESGLKVQGVAQEKNAEYQTLIAELEANMKAAENHLISTKREADKYYIEHTGAAIAYRAEKMTRAEANAIAYRKRAEGMVAKVNAVGAQGPAVLNSVIAKHVFPQLKNLRASPFVQPTMPLVIQQTGGK